MPKTQVIQEQGLPEVMRWEDWPVATANALFAAIREGALAANVNHQYPLKDAIAAHTTLEIGTTLGATALIP